MIVVLGGVLGAVFGSFLNVVIYRVPAGLSVVSPPSACPNCAARIRPYDNIPVVSWLVLQAKCRACRAPISARYPLIELATALSFAAIVAWRLPALLIPDASSTAIAELVVVIALLFFAAISIALAAIDLDTHRLPNAIVLPAYPVLAALLTVAAVSSAQYETLARAAAGAGILFAFYFVLALISPRGMGMGDVKLAGVIGLMLGWFGWGSLAVGALSAFVLGGMVGIALIVMQRARRTTRIPFGPWMLAGAWIGIAFGEQLAEGYLIVVGLR